MCGRDATCAECGDFQDRLRLDVCGVACEHQLRQLDAVRANILYPLQKMAGAKHYLGRSASCCGFLDHVARPAVGAVVGGLIGAVAH